MISNPNQTDLKQSLHLKIQKIFFGVSSLGVTGVRSKITTDIGAMVDLVREVTDVPVAVEFGISTPEQAKKMASQSDGAIVGSAIIKIIFKKIPHNM